MNESRLHGKWRDTDVPKTGWTCVSTEDLGEPSMVCDMCESATIRYVHRMRHPNYHCDLDCGCVCAGWMSEDEEGATIRDKQMRREAARRLKRGREKKKQQQQRKEVAEKRAEICRAFEDSEIRHIIDLQRQGYIHAKRLFGCLYKRYPQRGWALEKFLDSHHLCNVCEQSDGKVIVTHPNTLKLCTCKECASNMLQLDVPAVAESAELWLSIARDRKWKKNRNGNFVLTHLGNTYACFKSKYEPGYKIAALGVVASGLYGSKYEAIEFAETTIVADACYCYAYSTYVQNILKDANIGL